MHCQGLALVKMSMKGQLIFRIGVKPIVSSNVKVVAMLLKCVRLTS